MSRFVVFLVCTILSCYGIYLPLVALYELVVNSAELNLTDKLPVLIVITAWLFYFYIGLRWVFKKEISISVKIIGTVFGFASVIMTMILLLFVIALPAICLMLYIVFHYKPNQAKHRIATA